MSPLEAARRRAQKFEQFARGHALVLEGENEKASCYITHGPSLGFLREQMVSSFIRQATPAKYRVETGFIFDLSADQCSPQCDILVHNCEDQPPLYRWENLVVVQHAAARAAIEVKSALDSCERLREALMWHNSVSAIDPPFCVPTYIYALRSVTFETAIEVARDAIVGNSQRRPDEERCRNFPTCFAANDRHYLFVRPARHDRDHGITTAVCCVNFQKVRRRSEAAQREQNRYTGIETGLFLQFYKLALDELDLFSVYAWFDGLDVEDGGKYWIDSTGQLRTDSPLQTLVLNRGRTAKQWPL